MGDEGTKRVLVVGGGGRGHALAEAIRDSPSVGKVFFAPGTSGLESVGYNTLPVSSQDFPGLVEAALLEEIDLTVVGPNSPLVHGIVDAFEAEDLPIFGPNKTAAKLEGSKAFARMLMNRIQAPTPRFAIAANADQARRYAKKHRWGRVFKADGLAYGNGVRVTHHLDEVDDALKAVIEDNIYGLESKRIVVEERMDGQEITVFCLTDGTDFEIMGYVRNHPRLYEGEQGPPTRSMGQVSEPPEVTDEVRKAVLDTVVRPTIEAMNKRETPMRGALFVDLMLVGPGKPYVIDYNVRFGDPATQTLLSHYSGDFYQALQACRSEGQLKEAVANLTYDPRPRVSLLTVCEGYPLRTVRDAPIELNRAYFEQDPDLRLYFDGVKEVGGQLLTTGGRTFTIVAAADSVEEATRKAYRAVEEISYPGMHYRKDIGSTGQ